MKKMILTVSVLVVAALALSVVSPALAGGPSQEGPGYDNPEARVLTRNEYRKGFSRGEGMREEKTLLAREINLNGLLDDIIHEELELALELSPGELIDRLDNGETIVDIAFSKGIDGESVEELMADVRLAALIKAVELGLITQAQSDWLITRGFGNPSLKTGMDCWAE